jgi:hypothetical protein
VIDSDALNVIAIFQGINRGVGYEGVKRMIEKYRKSLHVIAVSPPIGVAT